jgi:hypothetical protein
MNTFYNTNFKERNGQVIECEVQKFQDGKIVQSVTLRIGSICKMEKNLIGESENRTREGTIQGFIQDDIGNPIWAAVRFFDTNRLEEIELRELL